MRLDMDDKASIRFWSKVDKTDACWNWIGGKRAGYGTFCLYGKTASAHRVSFQAGNPEPLGDSHLDHICHNPSCVRPSHLRRVNRKQNMEHRTSAHANSKSGVRGVHWVERLEKWQVSVRHNGCLNYGGLFVQLEDADLAARALRNKLFTHNDQDRIPA